MTLTFDQYLGIAGLLVGLVGVGMAARSDQKMKSARDAERKIEKKFMHFMAAQEFEKLAEQTVAVMGKVRGREWELVRQLADAIGPALGQATGGRNRLLLTVERDKLDAAAASIQQFRDSLPLVGNEAGLTPEQLQSMLLQCRQLVDAASEITGRLRVESILEPEDKK